MNELDRDRMREMLEYAKTAARLLGSSDEAALKADERTYLATRHALVILGEAANQVCAEARASIPDVPRRDAIAMRQRLVHGYRTVLADVIVQTVRDDLPELIASLEAALKEEGQ